MATSPRNRAAQQGPAPTSTYYIYDDSVEVHLGGVPIKEKKDGSTIHRTVDLNSDQAQYFINQGVIGAKPLTSVSAEARAVHHQLTGGGVPLTKGAATQAADPAPTKKTDPQVDRAVDFRDQPRPQPGPRKEVTDSRF